MGEHRQAVDLHQQTLADRERTLGPNHPDTLSSRDNLTTARALLDAPSTWRRWLPRLR
ncbi:tetratricopeptide repeat protein [Streptomyces arboris]|uniref:tetratricopeptide repeat protein n=1 Tax=Streptomyces arboris TaxID=2600619 RepID=UPI003C2DF2F8